MSARTRGAPASVRRAGRVRARPRFLPSALAFEPESKALFESTDALLARCAPGRTRRLIGTLDIASTPRSGLCTDPRLQRARIGNLPPPSRPTSGLDVRNGHSRVTPDELIARRPWHDLGGALLAPRRIEHEPSAVAYYRLRGAPARRSSRIDRAIDQPMIVALPPSTQRPSRSSSRCARTRPSSSASWRSCGRCTSPPTTGGT